MALIELTRTLLLMQVRSRHLFLAIIFFSVFLVFLFTLALPQESGTNPSVLSGVFWISTFFSGNLILSTQSSRQMAAFERGLMLTGTDASYLFLAKLFSCLVHLTLIQWVIAITMGLFYQTPLDLHLGTLFAISILGSLGFLGLGTLLFTLNDANHAATILITILFYPLVTPLFLSLHKATSDVLGNQSTTALWFIVGFDLLFVFLAALLYELVIEDAS